MIKYNTQSNIYNYNIINDNTRLVLKFLHNYNN